MSASQEKIPILDAMRFVAALTVMLVHYELIMGHFVLYGAASTSALSWFFVLSGFILSYTYPTLQGSAPYKRYYLHRIIRIFPVYWLAVIVSSLFVSITYLNFGEAFFTEVNRPFVLRYDLPEPLDVSFWAMATFRHLTFTQSLSNIETLNLVFNGPLWSLVLEMYFYLCFPLLLILLRKINTKVRVAFAFVGFYLLQFLLIQINLPDAEQYSLLNLNIPVYTNPLIRGIEFIFGMLVYKAFVLYPYRTNAADTETRWVAATIAVVCYISSVSVAHNYVPYQYGMYFATVPSVCFLVFALSRMNWHANARTTRICAVLGGLSYILYCFHWPLMEMLQFFNVLPDSLPFPINLTLVVAIVVVGSYSIYRFFETPIRKSLYRHFEIPK
jgi:peptidoglycan/LPS O-acetylase OafA/YrhL